MKGALAIGQRFVGVELTVLVLTLVAFQSPASAAVTAAVEDGRLVVTGDDVLNKVALRLTAADASRLEIDVDVDGVPDFVFARDEFTAIVVLGRDGNDQLYLDDSNGIFTDVEETNLKGQGGSDFLQGSGGPETLSGGRVRTI